MMKYFTLSLLIIYTTIGFAQTQAIKDTTALPMLQYAATITPEDLRTHLSVLASDEYMGRGTGQKGLDLAANYIAKHFANLDLPPLNDENGYFQPFTLNQAKWNEPSMTIDNEKFTFLSDFYAFPASNVSLDYTTEEILFLGYGIESNNYNDYKGKDVKGKVLLVLEGEPIDKSGSYVVSGNDAPSEWSTNWRKKLETASDKEAKAILFITSNIKRNVKQFKYYLSNTSMKLKPKGEEEATYANSAYISKEMAKKILGKKKRRQMTYVINRIRKKGKPYSFVNKINTRLKLTKEGGDFVANNVLGIIEGSDLKDEYVFITAHYDHLGVDNDKIYNGADDDGSGTVAALEIAEAFAKAKSEGQGPRRTVVVMTVSGEEKGLLGSEYYTDYDPIFPLANTVVDLNIDMVGRIDDRHTDGNYVYIIGSDKLSSGLHEINETMNAKHAQLELDYIYNADNDPNRFYYRSDHYNFAKNDIPVIFYFNGTHDDYHQPTDTVDKIEFEALCNRTKLVFFTAWEVANRDKRLVVDKKEKNKE